MRIDIKRNSMKRLETFLTEGDKAAEKSMKRLSSDLRTRIPTVVSKAVRKRYNIKAGKIKPDPKGKGNGKAGLVRVIGRRVSSMAIVYRGRHLVPTPDTFDLRPTAMPTERLPEKRRIPAKRLKLRKKSSGRTGGKIAFTRMPAPYTVSVKILKGKRKNLPAGTFVAQGSGSISATVVPFQRVKKKRNPNAIRAVQTVSLPQMVSNENVRPNIDKGINEIVEKRLAHHFKDLI